MHLDDLLPLIGVGLLAFTTILSILGAWALGRVRSSRELERMRAADAETRLRLERMEHSLEAVADEIERLGEVQRFALKIIGDKVLDAPEPASLPGRVITPH